MSDQEDVQDNTKDRRAANGDTIARLLRMAGPRPNVPAERADRVHGAVLAHWQRAVSARRRTRWLAWSAVPLAAAAVWIVLIATGVWERILSTLPPSTPIATLERSDGPVHWLNRPSPSIGGILDGETTLETGAQGRVALRLSSGASIRLDVETRLRLVSAEDLFLLRGAVYVDTGAAPGAGTTVTVRTPLGTVRDVGTQFQLRASGDAIRLSVREGATTLEHGGIVHDTRAGTELILEEDGKVTSRPVLPFGPEWDWIQETVPYFDLEGRLLGEYLDWIARETGLRVEYGDPSISSDASIVVLHGSVEGLRPDETLGAVLPTCGLKHSVRGESLIVERAAPGS
jgi:ferric-dicitrate binding protein FerR (iron transport regulator)